MATASDLISKALRDVGLLASGETADANDAQETLDMLNDLLDSWCLEDLMLYYSTVLTIPLVAGTISYTIGATGDLVAVRPIEILRAMLRTTDNLDIPIDTCSFENYQDIIQKVTTGTYPTVLAYQPTYPNGTVYLWQAPAAGLTLRLIVNSQLVQIADLDTVIDLPPGYRKCINDNLVVPLAIKAGKKDLLEDLKEQARISKMLLKRKNTKLTTMTLRAEFLPGNNGVYNPYSDT